MLYIRILYIFIIFELYQFNASKVSAHNLSSVVNNKPIISDIIDLKGQKLYIDTNKTLIFEGGKIINGTIIFNLTKLINPNFENCRFEGTVVNSYFNVNDFGIRSSNNQDCSLVINDLIKLKTDPVNNNNPKHLFFPKGVYYIEHPIELFAGYESPVTLSGEGNMSTICQRNNNDYIIKVFEQNHIKNLRLTYKNKQTYKDPRSIAIACQRSIFSIFENLTINKAHTAFGYITLSDQKFGYNPTQLSDQCYVSDNFRNIRIYDFVGYAFDFKKEFPQGDSGSVFDNIYINNSRWMEGKSEYVSNGAIRGDNTIAAFTQLNIEGQNYQAPLIDLGGFSRVCIQSLHLEGLQRIPTIFRVRIQSMLQTDILDIQRCNFTIPNYCMFKVSDNGVINITGLCIRPDCKFATDKHCILETDEIKGKNSISIANIIDGTYIVSK